MKKDIALIDIAKTSGWLILRVLLLNIVILLVAGLLMIGRAIAEPSESMRLVFPFQLFMTSLALANLVYVVGIFFEVIYHKLWNKPIIIREFEPKFFKTGLVMIGIVNFVGIAIFFLS